MIQRETGGKLESVPVNFEPKVYLGMIFDKKNAQLRDAFLKATEAMHADGSYDAILKKWDVAVINLPKPASIWPRHNPSGGRAAIQTSKPSGFPIAK
ncbi:transporter substrate-binding domain-containing protein [Arthrobacter sp. ERGS1:01]|uniref:transporter substrate-binding domain-containing protein n=1 Tax=Arthrobacter sp. ERGS1:01 TaxID=1704044 RepID=UPI000B05E7F3|nr:transporter substrate-binding domain-containing protein [Arthrobacter sp. ERGS1:01]